MNIAVRPNRFHSFFVILVMLSVHGVSGADTNTFFDAWFDAQSKMKTWSAEFTQTRSLKALSKPLTATGRIWFATPNQFRWEIGNPPQTMAIKEQEKLLIIYPRLKRLERYDFSGKNGAQWRDALALMEAGFPSSRAQLEQVFRVTSLTQTNEHYALTLQPKSGSAQRFLSHLRLGFCAKPFSLATVEVQFADGSNIKNEFRNAVLNPELDANCFRFEKPDNFTVVEPLGK